MRQTLHIIQVCAIIIYQKKNKKMSHIEKDKAVLVELEAELDGLEGVELDNSRGYIEQLRAEIFLAEAVQRAIDEGLRKTKALGAEIGSVSEGSKNERKMTQRAVVDFSQIGWINQEGEKALNAEVVQGDVLNYLFIDLTNMSRVTKDAKARLETQTTGTNQTEVLFIDKLYEKLKREVIPQRHDNMIHGRNMRVVHAGYPIQGVKNNPGRTFKTEYHTTKENVQGTNNRAIVMYLGNEPGTGLPLYALAALYDHDDDRGIHQTMCWSQK